MVEDGGGCRRMRTYPVPDLLIRPPVNLTLLDQLRACLVCETADHPVWQEIPCHGRPPNAFGGDPLESVAAVPVIHFVLQA
jgi:hypothetical protein